MNEYIGSLVAGSGGSGSDPSAMHYMGPVASAQDLPSSGNNPGDTYKASADFTITQGEPAQTINVEAGDSIVWDGAIWDVYQGNIDGAVTGPSSATDGHLAVFDGASGKVIKDGGALPDKWEIKDFSLFKNENPSQSNYGRYNSAAMDIYKNGSLYEHDCYYSMTYRSNGGGSGSFGTVVYGNGNDRHTLSFSTPYSCRYTLSFLIYEDSNRTKLIDHIITEIVTNVDSISGTAGVFTDGYASGAQVYNYSEAKANKITSITNQSTDTQYPSALAVKNYVDNNGFNPSSMQTVSDPVTLNTSQADWNQADSTAPDYIKNKPTIVDIWEIPYTYLTESNGDFTFRLMVNKNGSPYTESIHARYDGYLIGANMTPDSSGIYTCNRMYNLHRSTNFNKLSTLNIEDSSGVLFSVPMILPLKSSGIAANDYGFVTGDQVNTAIGNIETLLASI